MWQKVPSLSAEVLWQRPKCHHFVENGSQRSEGGASGPDNPQPEYGHVSNIATYTHVDSENLRRPKYNWRNLQEISLPSQITRGRLGSITVTTPPIWVWPLLSSPEQWMSTEMMVVIHDPVPLFRWRTPFVKTKFSIYIYRFLYIYICICTYACICMYKWWQIAKSPLFFWLQPNWSWIHGGNTRSSILVVGCYMMLSVVNVTWLGGWD